MPQEYELESPLPFGVDAISGRVLPGIDPAALQALIGGGHQMKAAESAGLAARSMAPVATYGTVREASGNVLQEAGWSVFFGPSVDQRIKDALSPLLEHRRNETNTGKQDTKKNTLFKVFEGESGYRPGDTASSWLARRGIRVDVVNPRMGVPYHILIVAPPSEIPFDFQYGLDIYWSVGRLWFDSPDQFRQYAHSVVEYETMATVATSRQAVMFAPRHDFDRATQLFCQQVAQPLVKGNEYFDPIGFGQNFGLQSFVGNPATKDALKSVLDGTIPNGPPALLFTGSHGMSFLPDDPRQVGTQGALVCQDWKGYGAIEADHWFSAKDVPSSAKVHGMIYVLFACHGAGCPAFDNFSRQSDQPARIASQDMLAALPQALLSHRNGGALAVLGHVERAWAYSFQSERGSPQVQGFRDVIAGIALGDRLGEATDQFNVRWAALSTELAEHLNDMQFGRKVPSKQLENLWVSRDDARNYIIFGDPAVRLRVNDMPRIDNPGLLEASS